MKIDLKSPCFLKTILKLISFFFIIILCIDLQFGNIIDISIYLKKTKNNNLIFFIKGALSAKIVIFCYP